MPLRLFGRRCVDERMSQRFSVNQRLIQNSHVFKISHSEFFVIQKKLKVKVENVKPKLKMQRAKLQIKVQNRFLPTLGLISGSLSLPKNCRGMLRHAGIQHFFSENC